MEYGAGELTLTLNTAEKRIQLLLSRGDHLLCAQDWAAPQSGAELLAPAIKDACGRLGEALSSITRIACVTGPGNFTGLRLALTTASGLSRAHNAQQAALNYVQALAASVPAKPGQCLRVAVNARRSWAYMADFIAEANGVPKPLGTIALLELLDTETSAASDAENALHAHGEEQHSPDYVLGSALSYKRPYFQRRYPGSSLLSADFDHPSFAALLTLTRHATWGDGDLVPQYLRDCDAVENLDQIARAQGRNPYEARAALERLMTEQNIED